MKYYVMYSLVNEEILGRFRMDADGTEAVLIDGVWMDSDGYVAQCLTEGRPNFVEVPSV